MRLALQNASRFVAQNFLAIFCRADSAHAAEYPGKVLLRFEAAGNRDVQYSPIGSTQHRLSTLNPLTQNKLMRGVAR